MKESGEWLKAVVEIDGKLKRPVDITAAMACILSRKSKKLKTNECKKLQPNIYTNDQQMKFANKIFVDSANKLDFCIQSHRRTNKTAEN